MLKAKSLNKSPIQKVQNFIFAIMVSVSSHHPLQKKHQGEVITINMMLNQLKVSNNISRIL
jgi:hypothetical protein